MPTFILYNKPCKERCADVFNADHNLPSEAIYSDDADFISTDHEYPSKVNEIAPTALGDWLMFVNVDKMERTIITVKPTGLLKNGGRPRNLDPCAETLRTCLAEKCSRSPLSVPRGLFGCEGNTSASNFDCVYIMHSCVQFYCRTRCVGIDGVGNGNTRCLPEAAPLTHRDSLATEGKQREVV